MSWIKFDTLTPDKPEVWEIAGTLGIDPDAVVGKLLRVWAWFDEHTEKGNAPSVTKKLLDRLVGVAGFSDAMRDAGWLLDDGNVIGLPNFDRHNGKTAKNRTLTAQRVAKHKRSGNADGNAVGNAPSVSGALPREREREREDTSSLRSDVSGAARASRLPADWVMPADWSTDAIESGVPPGAVQIESSKFRDYWIAKSGKDATKLDWRATWRNWCRTAVERTYAKPPGKPPKPSRHDLSTMNYHEGVDANGNF